MRVRKFVFNRTVPLNLLVYESHINYNRKRNVIVPYRGPLTHHTASHSFYNYKSLESPVAPNVALTPLQKGGQASPSAPSTSHLHGAESEGASRGRKRRLTGETQPSPQPCPSATASKPIPPPQEERESDVEVEVESREECEYSDARK